MHVMGPIGEEEGHVHSLGCRLKGRFPVELVFPEGNRHDSWVSDPRLC